LRVITKWVTIKNILLQNYRCCRTVGLAAGFFSGWVFPAVVGSLPPMRPRFCSCVFCLVSGRRPVGVVCSSRLLCSLGDVNQPTTPTHHPHKKGQITLTHFIYWLYARSAFLHAAACQSSYFPPFFKNSLRLSIASAFSTSISQILL